MSRFELLAPAGDLEKLKVAILYGADAVFIGGQKFSLRSRASNFTLEDIKEGCRFAHEHGAKIHVTCNIVMHEKDTDGVIEYLKALEACGVDCIIASSLYILKMVKEHTKMEAHVSTQQSSSNEEMVDFFTSYGVDRVVLARELNIEEIRQVVKNSKVDIEAFIHGGMCVSYSGRCMLSNNMTNRDANRGGCAHSCRWNYDLISDGKVWNPQGDYFAMSSKDLCAVPVLPMLMDAGVYSFKIEGRMKSLHYIATVVNAYRRMIDEYEATGKIENYSMYMDAILKAENRLTSTGFLKGTTTVSEQLYDLNLTVPTKDFIGIVRSYDKETKMVYFEQRNYFLPNSTIEVFSPRGTFSLPVGDIYDENNEKIDAARHPLQKLHFYSEVELEPLDLFRLL